MAVKKLKKIYYGLQGAKEKIDFEFSEFLPKETSISEFFSTYEKNFYSIPNSIHDSFIAKSIEYTYPEGWIHPLDEELRGLDDQVEEIKEKIDSIEKIHPYFKNGSFLMNINYKDNPDAAILENNVYYMQSAHKRQIMDSTIYYSLKNKVRKRRDQNLETGLIPNSLFLIFIDSQTIGSIPNGPPITSNSDAYISTLEVNRYNSNMVNESGALINRE